MSNRIDTTSPLAYARALREHPEEALAALEQVRRLPAEQRHAVDAILRASRDPDMGAALAGFVRSSEFQGCDAEHRTAILEALTSEPTQEALGRLMLLAGDAELRRMSPLSTESEIRAVLHGLTPLPGATIAERAGIHRPGRHVGPTVALDMASHAAEIAAEHVLEVTVVHATTGAWVAAGMEAGTQVLPIYVAPSAAGTAAAVAFPAIAAIAATYGGLHEIAEAHEQAEREREAHQFAFGFRDALSALAHGGDVSGHGSGPSVRGAAAAERFWTDLEPAQRVAIREHSERFVADLRRSIETATTRSSL